MGQTTIISPVMDQAGARDISPLKVKDKLLIIIYGCTLLLAGLGMRTLTRHEVLAAYPAKEMLLYGHWIVPMYAGIPRTAKPPGMNWIIAATMKIFHSESEFIVRLPSALSGVATGLMIGSFAARHYGRRIGIVSALMVMTSLYVLIQARLAESDMLLTALVCAAMLLFAEAPVAEAENESAPRPFRQQLFAWQPILFYLLTGITFLLKGFVGPAFILLGTIVYSVIQRDRRAVYFLLNPLGILLLLAMVAAWPVMAYLKYPPILQSWRFEQLGRLTGERGYDPFYFYLYSIPGSLLPWTPLMIVPAWVGLKNHLYRRPINKFFLCWFISGVILLSLSSFKHQHYAFPLLPPAAILGAIGLLQLFEHEQGNAKRYSRVVDITLLLICLVLAASCYFIPRTKDMAVGLTMLLGLIWWGIVCVVDALRNKDIRQTVFRLFIATWVLCQFVFVLIMPQLDDYRADADVARTANKLPPGTMVYIIDPEPQVEPHSAWYLRPPIRRFRDVNDFLANAPLHAGEKVYVMTNTTQSKTIAIKGTVETLAERDNSLKSKRPRDLILISYVPKP